jgi:hypothetical protein
VNLEDLARLLEGVEFDAKVDVPVEEITRHAVGVYREHVDGLGETTERAMGAVVRFVVMEAVPVAIQQVLAAVGAQCVVSDAYLSGGDGT